MGLKELLKISGIPVLLASLCCLSPIVLVLLGVSTVSFASTLSDVLYADFKWAFRLVGLLALALSILYYLRRTRGICTLDDARRRRNEVLNYVAFSLIACVLGYLFFLYIVVHYVGLWLALWV
ncbi:MAG TPA: hypothetical protein VFS75_03685 [Candidatus Paceibacterota bacterium]|nr:hypothetical protein [Candidatus Paceibacterota bacterium]